MKLVGIIANARHGKDTIAEMLVNRDMGWKRRALADEVKFWAMELYPFPEFDFYVDERGIPHQLSDEEIGEEKAKMRRKVYQTLGTECRRSIFPDYWIWRWAKEAMIDATQGWEGIVVPDIRFENEARYFAELNAEIIGVTRGAYRDPTVDYDHASEARIECLIEDFAQSTITNDGTIEEFEEAVRRHLKELRLL